MSNRKHETFSVQHVLDVIEVDDSDFGQSASDDSDTDDDVLYCPDRTGNLDVESGRVQEPVLSDSDNDENHDNEGNSNDDRDDDHGYNVPIATRLAANRKGKAQYRWKKKNFEPPDEQFLGKIAEHTDPTGISEIPLQYFQHFVTQEMLELVLEHTNIYSVQKHGKCINTSVKKLEQVLGMYFKMGLVEMPSLKMYWANETRYPAVADVMSRNRFQFLLRTIPFVDNESISDEEKNDRIWRIKPFLEMFRQQCLQVTPVQEQSVDKIIVPYKGKFSKIRQYIEGKPHPWGFKIWCRCSVNGLLHDFEVYQGNSVKQSNNKFGVGGIAVIKMCDTLQKHVNYKIFSDNYFTTFKLVEKLLNDGFLYVGTVKPNRLGKSLRSRLLKEKDLIKNGRGSHDYRVETTTNVTCLRWLDTKAVTHVQLLWY